ncbi:hypothetical protein K4F52_002184 [Lecanicillium sp. MT-2017a]|nr:hypothetical protein K4F52_002184 [Lecanicillium sp. MT-2017a]
MTPHPYYPLEAAIPHYSPNETPLATILPVFGGIAGAVVLSSYAIACRSTTRPIDRFAAAWFALCGLLHVTFEGYYIYHGSKISGLQSLYAQIWKEYALSDSRYLTSDIFTVCVETITVFVWGPLSWLTVLAILRNSPSRHFYQIIVCTAHLYGVALYYSTNWAEFQSNGVLYSRPEFLYYWVYYVGFNAPWAVVPVWLLCDSWKQMHRAFGALAATEIRKKL